LAGWLGYLKVVGVLGGLGAVGGLVFWLTLRSCGVFAAADHEGTAPKRREWRLAAVLAAAAAIASIAVAAIPSIIMDRSCHNMFRDGRRSVSSQLNIDLAIAPSDWPKLAQLLEDFGAKHGMSYRNTSEERPATVKILGISVCSEEGLVIAVQEQFGILKYLPCYAATEASVLGCTI
jgi:hypothetical protein